MTAWVSQCERHGSLYIGSAVTAQWITGLQHDGCNYNAMEHSGSDSTASSSNKGKRGNCCC
eukprot:14718035-Heterocapsa_arctica.AAC.1